MDIDILIDAAEAKFGGSTSPLGIECASIVDAAYYGACDVCGIEHDWHPGFQAKMVEIIKDLLKTKSDAVKAEFASVGIC